MDDFKIPLRRRNGDIAGYAIVDAEDYARLSAYGWYLNSSGYARRSGSGKAVLMHREVLGAAPFLFAEADHLNRERLDNRRSNLRWVTRAQNAQNKNAHRGSASTARGVWHDTKRNKWVGAVQSGGRDVFRKRFDTEAEAAEAAAEMRAAAFPFSEQRTV